MCAVSLNSFNENQIRESIEKNRSRVGQRYGDFEVVQADYDWVALRQINLVRCVRCGQEKGVVNLSAFIRGRGEGMQCKCRYPKKEEKPPKIECSDYVGQTVNGFRLLSYEVGRGFRVECTECGKQKWARRGAVLDGRVKCDHHVVAVYDSSIIGNKYGHLTAIEKVGKFFRFRCDCGFEKTLRPTDVCRGAITTCGRPECEHHINTGVNTDILETQQQGFVFEKQIASVFERAGYQVTRTPDRGDFGVDVLVEINGEKWAFQCKKKKVPTGSKAVAEVYAGGRFYDCTRFCVASPSGFTYQAKQMAAKLGVQLETDTFHFGVTQEENAAKLLETTLTKYEHTTKVMWEIDGVTKPAEQWCEEYGITRSAVVGRIKSGMDLKSALTRPKYGSRAVIEIGGVSKTKREWCDEYGISPQLYDYRIKYSGLSPIEALTKEKAR